MKVCDRCKKPIEKENPLKIKNKTYELCDTCLKRISDWVSKPQGILEGILNG